MALATEEKLKIVSKLLLASPPGEINDVFNDLRCLTNDDAAFQEGIIGALAQYNTEQFVTVKLPEQAHEVIVSKYNQLEHDQFIDPKSCQTFRFDHMRLVATDLEPHEPVAENEALRATLESAVELYVVDKFPNGVSTVFSTENETVTIAIVDNKYNPSNFWNGQWRSAWVVTPATGTITGTIKVAVHYYEDGNVQLGSDKAVELSVPDVAGSEDHAAAVKAYVKVIHEAEDEFEKALNETYAVLADSTFKSLRRALPLTRDKVDWDKITSYKIGQTLANKQ